MTDKSKDRRAQGRPRGGRRRGDRVRDYPTLTVRVPPETRAKLRSLAAKQRLALWQLVRHMTVCFVRDLPAEERRALVAAARARGRARARPPRKRPR